MARKTKAGESFLMASNLTQNPMTIKQSAALAALMAAENRAHCDVQEREGTSGSRYAIAGGDLDTQEKCGDYHSGFFLSSSADPEVLFFVTVGQDTFMDDDLWMQTLRPVVE